MPPPAPSPTTPPLPATPTAPSPAGRNTFHITRPANVCAISQQPIAAGQAFHAALKESPEGLTRIDVLPEFWPQVDRANILAHWQTVMPASTAPKRVFVDDAILLQLLNDLEGTDHPSRQRFRFVLTLLLMRKRLARHEGTQASPAGQVWLVRPRGAAEGSEPLRVLDPGLTDADMADMGTQLQEILSGQDVSREGLSS